MPHVNSGGNDDIYNSDEVKVYQHEGDEENEKNSSEILSEDKLGLVTETEEVGLSSGSDIFRLYAVNFQIEFTDRTPSVIIPFIFDAKN